MARKTSKFMIGLFVTVGVLIGLVAVVWLGASKYFEKGHTYVTYFNESVQGLQVDSAVKYRGVDVGRVEKIRVAPDNTLIEVVMKIDLRGHIEREYVAQLRMAGITGIVFIELAPKDPAKADLSPKVSFASEYPIIPSQPSDIQQILLGVQEIIENVKQVDTKGISDQIKTTTKEIAEFVNGEKMQRIMSGVDATVANLKDTTERIDQTLAAGKLEDVLVEAKNSLTKVQELTAEVQAELRALELAKTGANLKSATAKLDKIVNSGEIEAILAETRGTIASAKREIDSLKLSETVEKANRVMDGVDKKTETLTRELIITADILWRTLESLQLLLQRIKTTPSDLIFSQPPQPIQEEQGK